MRYNGDGSLDTTFFPNGDMGSNDDYGKSVTVQSDGKILVAGDTWNDISCYEFALVRYNSDGSLDTTFGVGGKVNTSFSSDNHSDHVSSVTVQADGKILVAGYAEMLKDTDFALVRYNSDGSLDTTFDADGKVTTDFASSYDYGYSVTVQGDGKILVAGQSGIKYGVIALARYCSDGSLDTTFDSDGKITTNFEGEGNSVTLQRDGKILVAGDSVDGIALVRYNSDGSLDTTFDADGKVITDFGSSINAYGNDYGKSVTVQSNGKIVVAGFSFDDNWNSDFALVRYNSDGSLDTTFDSDGKVTTDFGSEYNYGRSVTVQSDGKILVAGKCDNVRGSSIFALARYNINGSLDTTFDSNILNGTATYTEGGSAVVLDSDVQIVDAELAALGNYAGATLTLARHGSANAEDHFSGAGIMSGVANGTVTVAATNVGHYTWVAGTLELAFNANAAQALVNQAMQSIAYENISNVAPDSVQIDWTFNDHDSINPLSVTGSSMVTIIGEPDIINYNGHSYQLTSGAMTWEEAEAEAVAHGGHLVSVNSAAENRWLQTAFSDTNVAWIGFNDVQQEGLWVWTDGSPVTYTNWSPSEPNNGWGLEDAGQIFVPGYWNDVPITYIAHGIIEYPSSIAENRAPIIRRPQALSFADKVDYATGDAPSSVTSTDVNGDAIPDLILVNAGSRTMSILVNNGDGTFASKGDYAVGVNPSSVTHADLNGDGVSDLVVANTWSDTISVFINNGDGTFTNNVDYITESWPRSISTANVDGDGMPDLLVANFNNNTVSVFANNGNGTFADKVDYPTGLNPHCVTGADINGDRSADLIVANWSSNTVSVLLNNGNGTFADKVDYAMGSNPSSLAIADVNGDGQADLLVTNEHSASVSVLLGNGDGTFVERVDYATGDWPRSVTTVDVNGDGNADLACANLDSETLSVLINRGDGTFAEKVNYATGFVPLSVTNADVN